MSEGRPPRRSRRSANSFYCAAAYSSPSRPASRSNEVVFTPSARRALERELLEKLATAAFKFIMGPLRQDPEKVGKPLREPLAALFAARRGEYRVIYRIVDQRLVIEAVSAVHRRDA